MNLEDIITNEISHMEKNKYYMMYDSTYVRHLESSNSWKQGIGC